MNTENKILVKRRVKYVMLGIVFTSYLFLIDQELRPGQELESSLVVVRERAERLRRKCHQLRNKQRLEWPALFNSDNVNTCTNVFFNFNRKTFELCNVLKVCL